MRCTVVPDGKKFALHDICAKLVCSDSQGREVLKIQHFGCPNAKYPFFTTEYASVVHSIRLSLSAHTGSPLRSRLVIQCSMSMSPWSAKFCSHQPSFSHRFQGCAPFDLRLLLFLLWADRFVYVFARPSPSSVVSAGRAEQPGGGQRCCAATRTSTRISNISLVTQVSLYP